VSEPPLLQLQDLTVGYKTRRGTGYAVRGVDLTIRSGESWAIVGESGSGKSSLALAVMGLLDRQTSEVSGSARYDGRELLTMSERELRDLRGSHIGMIFQDPMTCLTPHLRIGDQVAEPLVCHHNTPWSNARKEAAELLGAMGIQNPAERARQYPHEFSGGMRQRAMIASAMACGPQLLVADEPTTALDVTIQQQILDLLRQERQKRNLTVLLITHDLGVVSELCDHIAVLYAGRVVETGPAAAVFADPQHPYTRALLRAVPRTDQAAGGELFSLSGQPPSPLDDIYGCPFAPRCNHAEPRCHKERPELPASDGHAKACHVSLAKFALPASDLSERQAANHSPALSCQDLAVSYPIRKGMFSRERHAVLKGIDLTVGQGEIVGLVGESGCGKTTLLRTVLGLQQPDSGSVTVCGLGAAQDSHQRRFLFSKVQLVFQDPYASLNPRRRIGWSIAEPLRNFTNQSRAEIEESVRALLGEVGLDASWSARYPHEFSGGQRQRIGIARALAVSPQVLLCDEPVSALDVSIQAQILNLLSELRKTRNVAILFVSHDLAVVRQMADRVAVMRKGRIIECRPTDALFAAPEQPYTRQLLAAAPKVPAV